MPGEMPGCLYSRWGKKGGGDEGSGEGRKYRRGKQSRQGLAALHAPLMCFLLSTPCINRRWNWEAAVCTKNFQGVF